MDVLVAKEVIIEWEDHGQSCSHMQHYVHVYMNTFMDEYQPSKLAIMNSVSLDENALSFI